MSKKELKHQVLVINKTETAMCECVELTAFLSLCEKCIICDGVTYPTKIGCILQHSTPSITPLHTVFTSLHTVFTSPHTVFTPLHTVYYTIFFIFLQFLNYLCLSLFYFVLSATALLRDGVPWAVAFCWFRTDNICTDIICILISVLMICTVVVFYCDKICTDSISVLKWHSLVYFNVTISVLIISLLILYLYWYRLM